MALKTSILIFYLTLTKGEKIFRWANYITLIIVNAAGFALTLINVFQCHPWSAVFHYPAVDNASCIDIVTLYLSSAPVNLITDLAIFFLPMPILTRMRLPLKQKIILIITFSFGVFTAVVDVIRVAYLQSAASSRAMTYHSSDSSHVNSLEHQDFSCMPPLPQAWLISSCTDSSRVWRIYVYVVSRRGQHRYDLCLRPELEALGRTSASQDDQGQR